MLSQAADLLDTGSDALRQTASGLSGVSWSGPAEGRFTYAAAGLSTVCRGASQALRACARATREYADELRTAKRIIERERTEYEQAVTERANAALGMSNLYRLRAMSEPEEQSGFDQAIGAAQDQMNAAADRAQDALARAQRAREQFDRAERRAIGELDGTAPSSAGGIGAPGSPATGRPPYSGPGAPFGPLGPGAPFSNSSTGGLGAAGGGFGVPPGGLAPFDGSVSKGDLGDLDPFANNSWDDSHGQTEVDDMTIAIVTLATLGTGSGVGGVIARGTSAARAGISGAARAGWRRLAGGLRGIAANPESRAQAIEKIGEGLGKVGVPNADDAGKIAALLSREEIRVGLKTQARGIQREITQDVRTRIAILRTAAELSRGVRRGIPEDVVQRMNQMANVP